jgi:hypothetical protein
VISAAGCQSSGDDNRSIPVTKLKKPKVLVPDEIAVSILARSKKASNEDVVRAVTRLLEDMGRIGATNPNQNLIWSTDWKLLLIGLEERSKRQDGKAIRVAAPDWIGKLSSVEVDCQELVIPDACLSERLGHLEAIHGLQRIAVPEPALRSAASNSLANEIRRLQTVILSGSFSEKDLSETRYKEFLAGARSTGTGAK